MTRGWIIVVSPTSVPPDRTACPENRDNGSATHQRRASGTIRKKKNTASDRFSDPPTRHPHDEPASPARFLLERGSFKRCASIAATAPAAPSQLAFQKSQADRTAINPRGQGRRKCRHRRDFRAAGPHFRRSARSGRVRPAWRSTGFPGG